jgi:hypothetical protein
MSKAHPIDLLCFVSGFNFSHVKLMVQLPRESAEISGNIDRAKVNHSSKQTGGRANSFVQQVNSFVMVLCDLY